mmetsp:Transcript_18065/g.30348  ORF Transcript_18065/g.30348 Transcript_18065/m.30348 type:complete len:219 (-) Transcript_18065:131-787(-)
MSQSASLAGTWGKESRSKYGSQFKDHDYTTTFAASFDSAKFSNKRVEDNNKFAKFRAMKNGPAAIMDSQKSKQSHDEVEETTNFDNSGTMLYPMKSSNDLQPALTASKSNLKLQKTTSMLLTQPNAPIAVGRSGVRMEKGVSTSGLLGERLTLHDDPQYNSFVQRTWLYNKDPSLYYARDGVPKYEIPREDLAFTIGEELGGMNFKGWTHHRKKANYL